MQQTFYKHFELDTLHQNAPKFGICSIPVDSHLLKAISGKQNKHN